MQGNVKVGDIVLLHDSDNHRNNSPIGLKEPVFRSKYGLVRTLELRVVKDGKVRQYVCLISEVVIMRHD